MNRRRFLAFSAALCAAGIPSSMACRVAGFSLATQRALPEIDPEDPVSTAIARARAMGKPLLVLIVPEEEKEQRERGTVIGSLLSEGDADSLIALSLCEVLCASMEELDRVVPDVDPEALMVLVETGADKLSSLGGGQELPELLDEDFETEEREYFNSFLARRDYLESELRDLVAADAAMVKRRGEESRRSLSDSEHAALLQDAEDAYENPRLVDRAAGLVLSMAAERKVPLRKTRLALCVAAKARVRTAPPTGAKWGNYTGCGYDLEDVEPKDQPCRFACGTGFTPVLGRRFLAFYV